MALTWGRQLGFINTENILTCNLTIKKSTDFYRPFVTSNTKMNEGNARVQEKGRTKVTVFPVNGSFRPDIQRNPIVLVLDAKSELINEDHETNGFVRKVVP